MPAETERLQFVDTNVLVYAHDRSAAAKHEKARALVAELWDSRKGCLSVQVLQEFYVTVTQKVRKPLSPEEAFMVIEDLSCWKVHAPQAQDVLEAIRIQRTHALSFWDAMIVRSAQAMGCGNIWSEDLGHDRDYGGVKVSNPFAGRGA
ncbi:MAG: PIN domain-containing protein [Actinobacteria bacterium]|nr:PIN domain-containing protein [Actinomycetota bacterium]